MKLRSLIENVGRYPEIEFVCVNKDVPGSTDPRDQEALYQSLKKVPGIVAYRQDFDDDEDQISGGKSLAVIITKGGAATAKKVKALAARHNVKIDLTAKRDDRFIDSLYTGSEPAVTDWFDNSMDGDLGETANTDQPTSAVQEDWGSSDGTVLVKAIDDAVAARGLSPDVIQDEAESLAELYYDSMGYDSPAEAVDAIIDTWKRRSETGRALMQMFARTESVQEADEDVTEASMAKVLAAKQKWAQYPTLSNEREYKAIKAAYMKSKADKKEPVTELSTDTLKSYKKKAGKQYDAITGGEEGEVHPRDFMGPGNTMDKRAKGINIANKKLNKSVNESDWGEPRDLLARVLDTLEKEVEWPLTDVMDPQEVKQLVSPLMQAVSQKLNSLDESAAEAEQIDELSDEKVKSYLRTTARTAKSPADSEKRKRGAAMAVKRLAKAVPDTEEDNISENMGYGYSPAASADQTNVNYSQTKQMGDATVTVSANAKSMDELHRVLKLAGLEVPAGSSTDTEEPAPTPPADEMPCGCDEPAAPTPLSGQDFKYSTDKQTLINVLRDKLQKRIS